MATGDNIRRMRNLKGMTQKELGRAIGFDDRTADVRVAQYESGTRTPKANLINDLSRVFDVSPDVLTSPDIDSYVGVMHTLFTLEDEYGLRISDIDGAICLRLDKSKGSTYLAMYDMFDSWHKEMVKLRNDEISKSEYDYWRYNYPRIEAERQKQARDERRE